MRSLWGVAVLAFVVACGGSSSDPIADGGSQLCVVGAAVACGCDGYSGTATCLSSGKPGGCDCSRRYDEDAGPGPTDAGCSSPTPWFRDVDGDGHGSGVPTNACEAPAGYVALDDDCDDTDARAYPGQTAFFTTPRPDGSFDFDCDKNSTTQVNEVAGGRCAINGGTCIGGGTANYWEGTVPPACGEARAWVKDCSGTCLSQTETRTQACR